MEKITIESLIKDLPEYEFIWLGKRNCVLKRRNHNTYYLCLIMSKEEPEEFGIEKVFFGKQYKYCIIMRDENADTLIEYIKSIESRF